MWHDFLVQGPDGLPKAGDEGLERTRTWGRTCYDRPVKTPGEGDPLHGVTLETIVTELVARYGWAELGKKVAIRCFTSDPSISSSLKFLRRTPWAREKVEALYLGRLRERGKGE